ncbi:MAG TPA: choice-of-anchor tandem repeat GloVer-containing protein [Rhizomicrobium sp.]|nr:choice-of-anchor tandem repeat GloVer-containing protein [Rhizomicrobium sp.]
MPDRFTIRATVLLSFAAAAGFVPPLAFAGTETVLYAFQGGADGAAPYAVPTMDAKGNLYGTTLAGGVAGYGIAYELIHSKTGWTEHVLHSFAGGTDGETPYGGVVVDSAGNVYGGTRFGGGSCDCGVVYELSPGRRGKWTETILYTFSGNQDTEGGPMGALTFDSKGNLYGTTVGDDTCGGYYGTVFELRRTRTGWKERDLHDFCGNDGDAPAYGQLVFDTGGNLYGTTGFGGSGGLGVVFELSPAAHHQWTFTQIHDFTYDEGGVADGGLMIDANGNLYGTAVDGGSQGNGSIYAFAPQGRGVWTESMPRIFSGSPDGALPFQNPVMDANGNLFGTTYSGGNVAQCYDACGTIYQLVPQKDGTWSESVVYDFGVLPSGADGYQPVAGLIRDSNGNFYGTTTKGGAVSGTRACDCGVVYEFTP